MADAASARRVLIVEDELPVRELLRLHLDAAGFAVEECIEGTGALRRLRDERSAGSGAHTDRMGSRVQVRRYQLA
jgi:CheY-like chemotaxis protein